MIINKRYSFNLNEKYNKHFTLFTKSTFQWNLIKIPGVKIEIFDYFLAY